MPTEELDQVLEHFGVKGMKWGVRRSDKQLSRARAKRESASEDATKAKESLKKAKKSGVQALSNKELQELNNRLNLEQNYSRLTAKPSKLKQGQQTVKTILGVGKTVNEAVQFAQSDAGKQIAETLKKKST